MSVESKSNEKNVAVDRVVSCGKCGKTWDEDNFVETQECLHKHDVGGYGSAFGDMREWSVTLCHQCAYDLLKPYIVWHDG